MNELEQYSLQNFEVHALSQTENENLFDKLTRRASSHFVIKHTGVQRNRSESEVITSAVMSSVPTRITRKRSQVNVGRRDGRVVISFSHAGLNYFKVLAHEHEMNVVV